MKKLSLYVFLGLLWLSQSASSFEIGQSVYFNACGSSPQKYFSTPLNIKDIVIEVPNKIIKLEKSKYDREFQTLAKSSIDIEGKQVNIKLSNFRNLTISDASGKELEEKKVSGATSIYEIKHKDKTIAWGVGWHKRCQEFYTHVDFTAFRLFVPYFDNGEVKIQNKLISLKINQIKDALLDGDTLILADGINIYGNDGASNYYYHGASFFEIDRKNGINFDLSFEELSKKIDINKLNPALILSTLTNYNQLEKLDEYTKNNFDKIYQDLSTNYWWNIWNGSLRGNSQYKIHEEFRNTLAKLSINEEKKNELFNSSQYKIPEKEIQFIKKNCLKKPSYRDVFDLIANCYPYHSSWMFNSITADLESLGFLDKYSNNPKLFCSYVKESGEFGEIHLFDLNKQSFNNLEISNSFIKFSFETTDFFVSSIFTKDTKLLANNVYKDSERKILEFRQSWYCEDQLAKITDKVQASKEEVQQPEEKRTVTESNADIAWKLDDKFIIPECFDYIWLTADNYEAFFDEYIEKVDVRHSSNPKFKKFATNIGNYLNKEVPLNHTVNRDNRSVPEISLTRQLEGCLSIKPETSIQVNGEYGSSTVAYRVIKSFDPKIGKELAPHISEKFESIKQVEIVSWGGGSMGPKIHTVVFGIIELEGKKVLLPLRNIWG